MRKGYEATLMFDELGEIFAFGTGSDATSEHEQGSKQMQEALCDPTNARTPPSMLRHLGETLGIVKAPLLSDDAIIAALREGKSVHYPELLLRKTLSSNLDKLHFVTGFDKDDPVALFGYSPRGLGALPIDHGELRMNSKHEVVGAWDERSFAIKVRGADLVAKLERFAEAVKAGDGLFAGTFLQKDNNYDLCGVIIARHSGLRPEHQEAIAEAQTKWEETLRLKSLSRVDELYVLARSDKAEGTRMPGYVWPVWKDGPDSEVVYALNPDSDKNGTYYGPYEFEELKKWIVAKEKYRMPHIVRKADDAA